MSNKPLTPPDVDLQDFPYMPLDVRRLRDSDLAGLESPEACWAAVLLWSASWHQIPAASLPDDDRVLANLAGYGRVVKEWLRVRDGALRGWVKCSDGRLYHPVVAEKAVEAWNSKQSHAYGKMTDRLRKSYGKDAEKPTFEQWMSAGKPNDWPQSNYGIPSEKNSDSTGKQKSSDGIPSENSLKGEGEGKGEIVNNLSVVAGSSEPDPLPQKTEAQPAPTRKGLVCGLLRKAGMADAAPHYLTDEVWETILAKRTDEEIVEVAKAKMAARPSQRTGLKYIAPALLEDPAPIASPRDSPGQPGRRQTLTDKRAETIAAMTGRNRTHERTDTQERDITGESTRIE